MNNCDETRVKARAIISDTNSVHFFPTTMTHTFIKIKDQLIALRGLDILVMVDFSVCLQGILL